MKKTGYLVYGFLLLQLWACNHNPKDKTSPVAGTADKPAQKFFPVTSFIRGQLLEISQKGVNPLHKITIAGHTDSSWVKMEEMNATFAPFLSPVIDTANLTGLFTETRFEDQTLNSYTFTHAPAGTLPDTMTLRHWDVYVNPETGKVKKLYIEKTIAGSPGLSLRLTWNTDKECKMVTIRDTPDGKTTIEKEEQINWDF